MPEINILVKAKDQVSGVLKDINKSFLNLSPTMMMLGTAGVTAIAAVGAAAGKLAYDAAQVEPLKIAFEGLSESIGETSESMLEKMRPATMGVLSDIQLMQASNKLMAMGLADSADAAGRLAEMSVKLGMAMGTDATTSLENFTLMLANQSIPRLDTFGISSGAVRERIDELTSSIEGMTREQAFMQAVLEQGDIAMGKIGDSTDTSAVKMAMMKAQMDNVKDAIGEALLPVMEELLDEAIIPLSQWIVSDLAPALETTLPQAINTAMGALRGLSDLITGILDKIRALEEWSATHLAPPEARGYLGRAETAGYVAETYLGQSTGGRYEQRVDINVYGINSVEDTLRTIGQIERHTVGSIAGP